MEITKSELKNFRNDFDAAVKALEEKYGVTVQLGNITFSEMKFTSKMTVTNKETKSGVSAEQAEFNDLAPMYGFEPSDYLKEFVQGGRTYTFVGFNPRAKKSPIKLRRDDGRGVKCSVNSLKFSLSTTV